jgi:hypothetical protein
MPLFLFIFHILYNIYSFNHIHTIHLSVTVHQGLSPFPHRLSAQWEKPPCGAEPRIKLGPAPLRLDYSLLEFCQKTVKIRQPLFHS